MNFNAFKYIVLCDGLYEQGFATRTEALSYLRDVKKAYPHCVFTIYDVDNGSERELDRIWYSYRSKCEEFERDQKNRVMTADEQPKPGSP